MVQCWTTGILLLCGDACLARSIHLGRYNHVHTTHALHVTLHPGEQTAKTQNTLHKIRRILLSARPNTF
uniref:Putative secreted protein n=1 Tax=Anopheles darlingi TaxID=43151 RepID=A0A2M4DIL3_ANODA